jgi:glycosyltransferase involved in cell wall biosynthesis
LKVSIITAVLNGARTIAKTLDSVAQQDYSDIEHVVADGDSKDGTLEIVRASHGGAARIISGADGGVYAAFNKGLRAATGDVIAYLNTGDTYESSSVVSRVAQVLTAFGVEAAFADALIVDPEQPSRVVRRYTSKNFSPRAMPYGFMPAHPTLFLRREVYGAAGEYDPGFRIAGDFEFCLRAFVRRCTSYRYIPEALVRMPSGGLSNRGWRSKWEITREMRRACQINDISTNWAKLCLRFPLKMAELA